MYTGWCPTGSSVVFPIAQSRKVPKVLLQKGLRQGSKSVGHTWIKCPSKLHYLKQSMEAMTAGGLYKNPSDLHHWLQQTRDSHSQSASIMTPSGKFLSLILVVDVYETCLIWLCLSLFSIWRFSNQHWGLKTPLGTLTEGCQSQTAEASGEKKFTEWDSKAMSNDAL